MTSSQEVPSPWFHKAALDDDAGGVQIRLNPPVASRMQDHMQGLPGKVAVKYRHISKRSDTSNLHCRVAERPRAREHHRSGPQKPTLSACIRTPIRHSRNSDASDGTQLLHSITLRNDPQWTAPCSVQDGDANDSCPTRFTVRHCYVQARFFSCPATVLLVSVLIRGDICAAACAARGRARAAKPTQCVPCSSFLP